MRHQTLYIPGRKKFATAASLSSCGGHRGPGQHDRKGIYGPRFTTIFTDFTQTYRVNTH